jgi:Lon protease-like protein
MTVSPMFPLGTVLFPGGVLPLHVFEPRYRRMVRDCLEGDASFGVVLIERGNEVGGGDTRVNTGTRARITDAVRLDDGRWVLGTVGTARVRVREWLPDDPYPQADVDVLADPAPAPEAAELVAGAAARLRRALALWSELGEAGPPATFDVAADPVEAAYQLASLAPIGPADAQRVLECETTEERLVRLGGYLDDVIALFAHRLDPG